jgi:hypothetical protein
MTFDPQALASDLCAEFLDILDQTAGNAVQY